MRACTVSNGQQRELLALSPCQEKWTRTYTAVGGPPTWGVARAQAQAHPLLKLGQCGLTEYAYPMSTSVAQLLFGLAGFAAAYALARALAKWMRRRTSQRSEEAALKNQSRQVRRANARARKRP